MSREATRAQHTKRRKTEKKTRRKHETIKFPIIKFHITNACGVSDMHKLFFYCSLNDKFCNAQQLYLLLVKQCKTIIIKYNNKIELYVKRVKEKRDGKRKKERAKLK